MQRALKIIASGFLLAAAPAFALTFSEWQASNFTPAELADPAISGPNADPDFDSYVNLAEYAHGLTPTASESIAMTLTPGPSGFSLIFPQRLGTTDLLYRVEESSDLVTWRWLTPNEASLITLSSNATTRTVSFLSPNAPASPSKWFMRVRSYRTANGTDELLAPAGLGATLDKPLAVNLTWNDNAKTEDGFIIERRVAADGSWETLGETLADTNTFADFDISGSTIYAYRVSAAQGSFASDYSNEVSLTTPLDSDQDGIPDDLEASYGTDAMRFSSGNNGVADGWWIRYGLSVFSNTTVDTDGDGRSDSEEFYDGTDPLTPDTDPNAGSGAPLAPSGLAITEGQHPQLNWSNTSPASGTKIQRTSDGANWSLIGVVRGNTVTFTDSTAETTTLYFYRVIAFN